MSVTLDFRGKAKGLILLEGLEGVVGVHDGVHDVIHDDEPAGRGRVFGVGKPGVNQDRHVMVPER